MAWTIDSSLTYAMDRERGAKEDRWFHVLPISNCTWERDEAEEAEIDGEEGRQRTKIQPSKRLDCDGNFGSLCGNGRDARGDSRNSKDSSDWEWRPCGNAPSQTLQHSC